MYTINMRFEWDDKKAKSNRLKHGISFKIAALAFDDPCALIVDDDDHSAAEKRQWLIGDSGENVLVVVYTVRMPGGNIRIISARRATPNERTEYEENKGI